MSATATQVTQLTAPNQTVEAPNGVSYAYRRLGEPSASAPPLVSFQHFRGNLDNWDPALVDALARTREVILFDNAGVGGSTGTVPRTVTAMAHDALSFIDALELREIDVLGYSLGGYVAQELVLIRPRLVRRLVLAGTGPQGGEDMHGFTDEMFVYANRDQPGAEDVLALFFETSETSVAKGREFLQRIFTRTDDRDTRGSRCDRRPRAGIPSGCHERSVAARTGRPPRGRGCAPVDAGCVPIAGRRKRDCAAARSHGRSPLLHRPRTGHSPSCVRQSNTCDAPNPADARSGRWLRGRRGVVVGLRLVLEAPPHHVPVVLEDPGRVEFRRLSWSHARRLEGGAAAWTL